MESVFGISLTNVKEFAAAIAGIIGFAFTFFRIGRAFGNKADKITISQQEKKIVEQSDAINIMQERLDQIDSLASVPQDFWTRQPKTPFDHIVHCSEISRSIPIISIVNFKGGVGKTTICANLAGYFAWTGRRVLLIDFDYQGSLSDTFLSHARIEPVAWTSQRLIEGNDRPEELRGVAERLSPLNSNLWLYPAFYGFSRSEMQVMFRWLVGKDTEVRFNLHRYLQSSLFQAATESCFDLVLIDCPPRLLTGTVNALAASTHVLVPTILDGQSHVATLNTLQAIQQFRQTLNKNLKTLGVVPSMVSAGTGYNERETHFIEELERQIPSFHEPTVVLKERPIVRKEQLARAGGSEVIYFSSSNDQKTNDVRAMFSNLAQYVEQHLNWRHPETGRVITMTGAHHEDRRFASRS